MTLQKLASQGQVYVHVRYRYDVALLITLCTLLSSVI